MREEKNINIRERNFTMSEKHQLVASRTYSGVKPATLVYVLQEIELSTFCCMGQCSNQMSTPTNRPGLDLLFPPTDYT